MCIVPIAQAHPYDVPEVPNEIKTAMQQVAESGKVSQNWQQTSLTESLDLLLPGPFWYFRICAACSQAVHCAFCN